MARQDFGDTLAKSTPLILGGVALYLLATRSKVFQGLGTAVEGSGQGISSAVGGVGQGIGQVGQEVGDLASNISGLTDPFGALGEATAEQIRIRNELFLESLKREQEQTRAIDEESFKSQFEEQTKRARQRQETVTTFQDRLLSAGRFLGGLTPIGVFGRFGSFLETKRTQTQPVTIQSLTRSPLEPFTSRSRVSTPQAQLKTLQELRSQQQTLQAKNPRLVALKKKVAQQRRRGR